MLIIGLTGGIGSGKTAVSDLFRQAGVAIIDADKIGRHLSAKGQTGYQAIINEFGSQLIADNGELDRDRLRNMVFNDATARKKLESLLHPLIREEITRKLREYSDEAYCIVVVPLLLETDYRNIVDRILIVDATEENQIERVMRRDNLSRDKVKLILAAQLPRTQRLRQADDIIVNDSDVGHLAEAVAELHSRYLQLAGTAKDSTNP